MSLFGSGAKGNDGAFTPSAKHANSYNYPNSEKEVRRVEAPARAGAKGDPGKAKSN